MDTHQIVSHVRNRLTGIMAIYLYGSQASGHATAQSDVDVAVLNAGLVDPLALWTLSGEIADIAGAPVDLIDLRAASTVMQYQVITQGLRLWARDADASLYEAFILSEKTALDEARAGVLQDILKSGNVHGR